MTCIIQYDGLRKYDDLSPVTAKISEKLLRAKKINEDQKMNTNHNANKF